MVRYAFSKVGMTSAFTQSGTAQGVTVLKMQPAKVLRHETLENGKVVVVVEYDTGHKNKLVRGWVVENPAEYEVGSPLKAPSLSVGQKLKSLSKDSQVVCITHLPQVASFADHHLLVEKTPGKRTRSKSWRCC